MKLKRQNAILEIIKEKKIETQDELSTLLKERGFETTQATISRDIKELKIIKVNEGKGKPYYAVSSVNQTNEITDRLSKIFREGVINIEAAENIVVLKTLPALASAACSAIDSMQNADLVGTLAGDDTGILIMRSKEASAKFVEKIKELME